MSPDGIADVVTSAVLHELAKGGVLVEPAPPVPAMTLQEAAELLCTLGVSPRLKPPHQAAEELLRNGAMVTYAWRDAQRAGIDPADQARAFEAKALLTKHHTA